MIFQIIDKKFSFGYKIEITIQNINEENAYNHEVVRKDRSLRNLEPCGSSKPKENYIIKNPIQKVNIFSSNESKGKFYEYFLNLNFSGVKNAINNFELYKESLKEFQRKHNLKNENIKMLNDMENYLFNTLHSFKISRPLPSFKVKKLIPEIDSFLNKKQSKTYIFFEKDLLVDYRILIFLKLSYALSNEQQYIKFIEFIQDIMKFLKIEQLNDIIGKDKSKEYFDIIKINLEKLLYSLELIHSLPSNLRNDVLSLFFNISNEFDNACIIFIKYWIAKTIYEEKHELIQNEDKKVIKLLQKDDSSPFMKNYIIDFKQSAIPLSFKAYCHFFKLNLRILKVGDNQEIDKKEYSCNNWENSFEKLKEHDIIVTKKGNYLEFEIPTSGIELKEIKGIDLFFNHVDHLYLEEKNVIKEIIDKSDKEQKSESNSNSQEYDTHYANLGMEKKYKERMNLMKEESSEESIDSADSIDSEKEKGNKALLSNNKLVSQNKREVIDKSPQNISPKQENELLFK